MIYTEGGKTVLAGTAELILTETAALMATMHSRFLSMGYGPEEVNRKIMEAVELHQKRDLDELKSNAKMIAEQERNRH